jgi:hypothetical protein
LHGSSPSSTALPTSIFSETFFTLPQLSKWYFAPDGVLKTSCALEGPAIKHRKAKRRNFIVLCKIANIGCALPVYKKERTSIGF